MNEISVRKNDAKLRIEKWRKKNFEKILKEFDKNKKKLQPKQRNRNIKRFSRRFDDSMFSAKKRQPLQNPH